MGQGVAQFISPDDVPTLTIFLLNSITYPCSVTVLLPLLLLNQESGVMQILTLRGNTSCQNGIVKLQLFMYTQKQHSPLTCRERYLLFVSLQ